MPSPLLPKTLVRCSISWFRLRNRFCRGSRPRTSNVSGQHTIYCYSCENSPLIQQRVNRAWRTSGRQRARQSLLRNRERRLKIWMQTRCQHHRQASRYVNDLICSQSKSTFTDHLLPAPSRDMYPLPPTDVSCTDWLALEPQERHLRRRRDAKSPALLPERRPT